MPITAEAPHPAEERIIELVDWAREFLATEVEGQYTSDAALQLALAVWLDERNHPNPGTLLPSMFGGQGILP